MADINNITQTPMGNCKARFVGSYLLIVTVLTSCAILSVWFVEPRLATDSVPPPPACAEGANPVLSSPSLYPDQIYVGSTAADVLVLGCHFTQTTQVKFNGAPHPALFVDASHIRVVPSGADVAAAGTIVVTLSPGGDDSGSGLLYVVPPVVYWQIFCLGSWPISQELQLLLLVFFTGAFGSCVYALKSFADYRGENRLYDSWFTYYLIQPFEGAGTAFLLYLVIRGGFLAGTAADVKTVNLFGMCAIAGLSGAFSDIAFLKLREVFQTLFKPQDDRGGKMSTPKITTTILVDGAVGIPYKQALQASGGVAPLKWSVSPALPASLTLDAATGIISGTPATALAKTKFTFTVTDSATHAAPVTADLTLEIK